jgi:6-phosphofructokinase
MEVMGRDAGWLTGSATFGGATLGLVPEFEITKARKEAFFDTVKEAYMKSRNKYLVIPVSEGVR